MEHVLCANHFLSEWKPELINEILDMLTPERIRITTMGKLFEPICDLKEKWYGTKYYMENISRENIEVCNFLIIEFYILHWCIGVLVIHSNL